MLVAYLIHWLVSSVALFLTAYLVPGFRLRGFGSAMVAAIVVGLANTFVRPFLLFLTFPINLLTLGLFTFVVNGAILKMCAAILRDFEIEGWFSAILGAVILTIVSSLLHFFLL